MLKKINSVKFCNNNVNKIEDFKIQQNIMKTLFDIININYIYEININSENILDKIKNNNYKIMYFNNKDNYILFIKEINNIYYVILIKNNFGDNFNEINYNKLEIYFFDIPFTKDYFSGTILLGNLDSDNEFNLYDILCFKGNLINDNLENKRKLIDLFIKNIQTKYLNFKLKDYYELNQLTNVNNNVLFIPFINDFKYIYTKKNNFLTKKYNNFIMKKINTDVFNLYYFDKNEKHLFGIANIPNLNTSKYFNKFEEEIKVKCWYENKFNKWTPFEILDENDKISNLNDLN